jgi:hypothetical protein
MKLLAWAKETTVICLNLSKHQYETKFNGKILPDHKQQTLAKTNPLNVSFGADIIPHAMARYFLFFYKGDGGEMFCWKWKKEGRRPAIFKLASGFACTIRFRPAIALDLVTDQRCHKLEVQSEGAQSGV